MLRRPRVFVMQPAPERPLAALREFADVDMFPHADRRATRAELEAGASAADYLFVLGENPVDDALLAAAERVRLVAAMEIFPVAVDLAAATARGIPVAALPQDAEITETTAEFTFALLAAAAWRIPEADRFLRAGRWVQYQSVSLPTRRLRDKTLGILGLGMVGRGVAARARGHRMRILYHDRVRALPAVEAELGAEPVGLDELFARADFLVVSTTLTAETEGLVGARLLRSMQPHAVLINTSRGRVLDESALCDALEEGRIAGAALDVYRRELPDHEPAPDPRLLRLDNVILTPHVGTSARETREWMAEYTVRHIRDHLAGRRPRTVLNPEVYGDAPLRPARIG